VVRYKNESRVVVLTDTAESIINSWHELFYGVLNVSVLILSFLFVCFIEVRDVHILGVTDCGLKHVDTLLKEFPCRALLKTLGHVVELLLCLIQNFLKCVANFVSGGLKAGFGVELLILETLLSAIDRTVKRRTCELAWSWSILAHALDTGYRASFDLPPIVRLSFAYDWVIFTGWFYEVNFRHGCGWLSRDARVGPDGVKDNYCRVDLLHRLTTGVPLTTDRTGVCGGYEVKGASTLLLSFGHTHGFLVGGVSTPVGGTTCRLYGNIDLTRLERDLAVEWSLVPEVVVQLLKLVEDQQ
jgi:hypothetical protein